MPMKNVLKQYGHIISSRTYFPLWLGQVVSNFGDIINYVALVVLVYQLSGSGLAVAVTVVLEIIPVLLLAFASQSWQVYVIVALLTCYLAPPLWCARIQLHTCCSIQQCCSRRYALQGHSRGVLLDFQVGWCLLHIRVLARS